MKSHIDKNGVRVIEFRHDKWGDGLHSMMKDIRRLFGDKASYLEARSSTKCGLVGAEIGSFAGESSRIISQYCDRLYCVDMWESYDGSGCIANQAELTNAEERFRDVMLDVNSENGDTITMIKDDSLGGRDAILDSHSGSGFLIPNLPASNILHFAYIDACHEYKMVKRDIDGWRGVAAILCGHDYARNKVGVRKAVDEYISSAGLQIIHYSDTSWLAVSADQYNLLKGNDYDEKNLLVKEANLAVFGKNKAPLIYTKRRATAAVKNTVITP